jgi:signal peptidase I
VAIAGDTLQIKDQVIYINGKPSDFPKDGQFKYLVRTDGNRINPMALDKMDVTEDIAMTAPDEMLLTLTNQSVEKLRGFINVKEVKQLNQPAGFWQPYIFPFDSAYPWNVDNFGPLVIPKAGMTVEINKKNIVLYSRIIKNYENNSLEIVGDQIIINGQPATEYTFKMDYYWMMGDNRHNSADSRFWGFVPNDHIVGKAVFVWLSLDNRKPLFGGKIRFNKLFRTIH